MDLWGYAARVARLSGIDWQRLPPGTHGIDRSDVVRSQRLRMFRSAAESMVERGYARTTVADIVSRAGVSRRTFYEQFRDRDECFADAFEYCLATVVGMLDESVVGIDRDDWRALLTTTLRTYLFGLAHDGVMAQVLHVASLVGGGAMADQRRTMRTHLATRMQAAFAIGRRTGEIPVDVPAEIFEVVIGAIDDRIRDCIQVRGTAALPELAERLNLITLALFGLPEWGTDSSREHSVTDGIASSPSHPS